MTPIIKRYALSSIITFVSIFLLLLGTNLQNINPQTLTTATILGAILVAGRAAVKMVLEGIVGSHADLPPVGAPTVTAQQ